MKKGKGNEGSTLHFPFFDAVSLREYGEYRALENLTKRGWGRAIFRPSETSILYGEGA